MPTSKKRKTLAGSQRKAQPDSKPAGKVDPAEWIEITVLVRPRATSGGPEARAAARQQALELGAQLPAERQYVSREEFAAQHGADPDDLAKIDAFAHAHNLTVVQASIPRRTVKLAGTLADLTAAFKAKVQCYRIGRESYRGRTGSLSVPAELADIIVGVFGFDERPTARPHYRRLDGAPPRAAKGRKVGGKKGAKKKAGGRKGALTAAAAPMNASDGSFTPPEVARLYNFPVGLDGKGQCIAIIELNTKNDAGVRGAGFITADLEAYFERLNIPLPEISAIGVDGGANLPGINLDADGEVMLDIEVAGAVAPGAKLAVYFAPNTGQGFLDAVQTAIHDNVRKPSIISISWGGPEDRKTEQFRNAMDQAFQDAAALGVTVCCSAGDDGSSDQLSEERDGKPHVDFPAASPFALACGGTKLVGAGTSINSEVVWNEGDSVGSTGGGVSNFFPLPSYQAQAQVPKSPTNNAGRGVPDVAGNADPRTGYKVRASGQDTVVGGTSAVAPLWAALVALINQRLANLGKQPAGFLNPLIYSQPAVAGLFRDIIQGNNDIDGQFGKYEARQGWDACTGLGSPDGFKLMQALGG